jgi:hypothetical protein
MVVAPPPAEAKAKAGVASGGDDSDVETLLEISGCAMRGQTEGAAKQTVSITARMVQIRRVSGPEGPKFRLSVWAST